MPNSWAAAEVQKLPRICGQSIKKPALGFGQNSVECKRTFPGPADTRYNGNAIAWNLYRQVFEIMFICSLNINHASHLISSSNNRPPIQMRFGNSASFPEICHTSLKRVRG